MPWLEWTIGLRYALVGRGDRFVSFSSIASAIGIALGVAAVIVVMSVMNGFHINLRERILAASSHVEVFVTGVEDWRTILEDLAADPRVAAAAPEVDRHGLLSSGQLVRGVLVKGIDPDREADVSDFRGKPELNLLQPGTFRVLLGTKLAERLAVVASDKVLLLAPDGTPTLGGILPRLKRIEVVGTVSFGVHQFDDSLAYMHHEDAAKVFKVAGVDTIRLRLHDVYRAPAVASEIRQERNLQAHDWTTSNATLFNALAVERRVMFVILSLIIAVAAFQIVAALVTMVRSKRGAIAIIRTIGMPPAAIMRIFLIQGLLVGLAGTILGVVTGLVLAVNVNAIVMFVEGLFGVDFFPGEVYYLDTIPSVIIATDVIAIATLAFGLTLLATIFPSVAAARVDPAEALRYE